MTKKQRELLSFIEQFINTHGYSPSYREIMSGLNYKSVSTVAIHVDNLIILGELKKADNEARSLELVHVNSNALAQKSVTASQEKWLIDIVTHKFEEIEKTSATQKQIDDLFVLVGALHVLGLEEAAASFKTKLKNYR